MGSSEDMMGNLFSLSGYYGYKAGYKVSISNDGMVALIGGRNSGVGAFRWEPAETSTSSSVIAGKWNQLGSYGDLGTDSNSDTISVSLSGDGRVALIGFYGHNSNSGVARAYQWNEPVAGQWNRLGYDDQMLGEANDNMGRSVSISKDGRTALVGAGYYGPTNRGTARLYRWNMTGNGGWDKVCFFFNCW